MRILFPRLNTCPMCRAPLGSVEEDSDFESDDSHIDEANHAMLAAAEDGHKDIVRLFQVQIIIM